MSEAGLKKLRDEVSEELNEKHLEVLKEKSKKLEKYKKKLEKQEKEYQNQIQNLHQANEQLKANHIQEVKILKADHKESLRQINEEIVQIKDEHN